MQIATTQLADTVFKFTTNVDAVGMSFNQFLVTSQSGSVLIETGFRQYFPLLREAIESIVPVETIQSVVVPHFEGDEMGALGELLLLNPRLDIYATPICAFSIGDLFGVEPGKVQDGQILKCGRLKLKMVFVPQVHQWDALVVIEEKTGILFSSDMFIQLGDGEGFAEGDLREALKRAIQKTRYLPSTDHWRSAVRKVSAFKPKILAPMHGRTIKNDIGDYLVYASTISIDGSDAQE